MGAGLKRARAAARATQLRWWTEGMRGAFWFLAYSRERMAVGTVCFADRRWEAAVRGKTIGTYPTCRAAKLAVRRAVRGGQ